MQIPIQTYPHSLPSLPHPVSSIAPDASAYLLLNEARRNVDQLDSLKEDVLRGSVDYFLSPPSPDAPPPLPSIPVPPVQQPYRRSSIASLSKIKNPVVKPSVPSTLYLSQVQSLDDCLEAFNREHLPPSNGDDPDDPRRETVSVKASLLHQSSTVSINYRTGQGGVVYVLLRSLRRDGAREDRRDSRVVEVESVRVYPSSGHSSALPMERKFMSTPYSVLSNHLTELELSLPELLYRIPALPDLLTQPCFYCQRHLKNPDGRPLQRTGWLESRRGKQTNGTAHLDYNAGLAAPEDRKIEEDEARWVCWHESCEPLP